jgi:hypothetical protein
MAEAVAYVVEKIICYLTFVKEKEEQSQNFGGEV